MTTPDRMPRHTVVQHIIECSCGARMPAYMYERHAAKEAGEVGRWIADRLLDKMRDAITAAKP